MRNEPRRAAGPDAAVEVNRELHDRIVRAGPLRRVLPSRSRSVFRPRHVSAGVRVRALSRNNRRSARATQARDSVNQGFFLPARPAFHFIFALQRISDSVEGFKVHEADRTAAGRVPRAAPAVVQRHPSRRIACVAGVERSVGAADDVDVVHRGHYACIVCTEMRKYYSDAAKYKSYLDQLGIKYPTVR